MKRIFFYVTFGLQLLLCVSPFIPYVRQNIWAAQVSVNGFASALASYVGLQFLFLSCLVYLQLDDFKSQAKEDIDKFGDQLRLYTPLQARKLRENEFYKDFLGHCVRANHYVDICYFSPRPPTVGGSPERIKYYANIAQTMKNNPGTRFRRIVRDTEENREWTEALALELQGSANCYIAMLRDADEHVEMARSLSVQIVDGKIAWLVAIAEHDGAAVYRDLAIENAEVTQMLDKYFDRLWNLSRVVFQPGYDDHRVHEAVYQVKE